MSSKYLSSILDYIRLLVTLVVLSLLVIFVITGDAMPWFLSSSGVIVILALINYIDLKSGNWGKFSLLMLGAMVAGFIGDLLMNGIFYITPIEIINGVMFFSIGHILYLFALKERSPLLLNPKDSGGGRLITRNLLIWIVCIVAVILLVFFTAFNPADMVLSGGFIGYGILLGTVFGFSLAKWFDEYPIGFRLLLVSGFFMFIFSDWLIGVHEMTDPTFLSGPWVGITYIFAQLPIHLSVFLGARGSE
ncbi:MAG: lysoplasmalogenase family protein [Candidatus Thorarchaeota archaeon]